MLVLGIEDRGLFSSVFVLVLVVPNRKLVIVVHAVVDGTLEELVSETLVFNHTE